MATTRRPENVMRLTGLGASAVVVDVFDEARLSTARALGWTPIHPTWRTGFPRTRP